MPGDLGGLMPVALVVGVFVGVVVGSVSVVGGTLAVQSAQVWPPRSEWCWRQRFAACSAAAVFLLSALFAAWTVLVSAMPVSADSTGRAGFLMVSIACAVVAYACTLLLAPATDSSGVS
ncbi:hypothetical protein EGT50_04880 [Rhodococcus xishaensis]|uniref:Uncharacterized protein n=1 Tax=Rhodococcus xishaensis TaxID=2487364 RepID=A0A3S3AB51_9NOCA|nr:hypothetical protein EGT50_04880 [Rhodococcus xishaensis]